MAMTYKQQLADPRWQKRRLTMLDAAGWACRNCHSVVTQLHVHHIRYVKGRMAWEYQDHELEVLCADCHGAEHEFQEELGAAMAVTGYGQDFYRGLVAGFLESGYDLFMEDHWPVCGDARFTGRIAHLFFHSDAETKRKVAIALADGVRPKSEMDVETLASYGVKS